MGKMLQAIGFKPKKVPFIPYSGFNGDNLVEPVDAGKCPWYKGWTANKTPKKKITGMTIVDALNNFITPPKREPDAPLRLPVSNIYNIRESVKLSAVPSNRELFDLVTKSDSSHPTSRERRSSPSNSTRRSSNPPDLETLLVFPSRVLPRTRRSPLEISSTTKTTVSSSLSRASLLWSPFRSTLVSSSLDTALLSSPVPPRLLAR